MHAYLTRRDDNGQLVLRIDGDTTTEQIAINDHLPDFGFVYDAYSCHWELKPTAAPKEKP